MLLKPLTLGVSCGILEEMDSMFKGGGEPMGSEEAEEVVLRSLIMGRRLSVINGNRETFAAIQEVLRDFPVIAVEKDLISRDESWLDRHGHTCELDCLLDDPLL